MRPFLIGITVIGPAAITQAQTIFGELEPNEVKSEATPVICALSGDILTGTSTGAGTASGAPGSVDTFRVMTCPEVLGIYRHDLDFSAQPAGVLQNLLGLAQVNRTIQPGTDIPIQVSEMLASSPRFKRWYGFGKSEQVYLRLAGNSATTWAYAGTFVTVPVVPVHVDGTFAPGTITIDAWNQGHTEDTEFWVYDADYDAIPGCGNDEPGPTVSEVPARLVRTFGPGHYTVATSHFNLANDQPCPPDDAASDDHVTDFPDVLINSDPAVNLNLQFSISDGLRTAVVAAVQAQPYSIFFVSFDVGGYAEPFCAGDGFLADHTTPCPCGNDSTRPGFGCAHSYDPGGAHLTATGTAATDDVVLHSEWTPSSAYTLFLQHDAAGDAAFHDGVLCASGNLLRLRGRSAVQGTASFPNPAFPNDATLTLSQSGQVTPGQGTRRYYTALYRNPSPSFCPPATANATNGYRIDW